MCNSALYLAIELARLAFERLDGGRIAARFWTLVQRLDRKALRPGQFDELALDAFRERYRIRIDWPEWAEVFTEVRR